MLNVAPNSGGAGPAIWMSGGGPAADSAGNIYLLTANGAFETTLDANGFPKSQDFGNSFLKLSTAGGSLSVADYFTMYNEVAESAADEDLGSGGAMLLPDLTDSSNTVRHLVDRRGQGRQYLRRQSRLHGKVQFIRQRPDLAAGERRSAGRHFFDARLFQRHRLLRRRRRHAEGVHGIGRQTRGDASIPVRDAIRFSGHRSGVSANGTSAAIVWAHENSNPAVLHAYDAANLQHELYNSNQAAGNRDHFGAGNKFITPTIADGKVFVGTTNSVAVFGLLH